MKEKKIIFKCALTGKQVTERYAKSNPKTTYRTIQNTIYKIIQERRN